MCYSGSELLELNTSATHDARLPISVYNTITALGIACKPATRRGTRAGRKKSLPSVNASACSTSPSQARPKFMNVSLWNAQSIRNKIPTLHDNIIEKDTDIVFITETWLSEKDQVVLGELPLPGYSVLTLPRTNQGGGGVGAVFKSNLKLDIVNNKLPHTTSFEHALIYYCQNNVNFVLIYRSSSLSVSDFLPKFDEFLSVVDFLPGRSIILGDFNIHRDQPFKSEVKRANTILNSFSFTQIVRGPTHKAGHTLDWIVIKENDSIIEPHTITELHVSDHFYIDCRLSLLKPCDVKTTYISRNYRSINSNAFDRDLATSFPKTVLTLIVSSGVTIRPAQKYRMLTPHQLFALGLSVGNHCGLIKWLRMLVELGDVANGSSGSPIQRWTRKRTLMPQKTVSTVINNVKTNTIQKNYLVVTLNACLKL